jgi:hypothetical protein
LGLFEIEIGPGRGANLQLPFSERYYMLITIKIYNQPRKFLKSEKLLATFWATVELCGLEIGNLERCSAIQGVTHMYLACI